MKKRVWNLAMKMKMTKRRAIRWGERAMKSNSKIKNMVLKK